MPRKPRSELEPGIWHVYARGNNKGLIYRDDEDRAAYLNLLGKAVGHRRWHCLAFCLMPNHMHLLIETTKPNLGAGLGAMHGRYVEAFHRRHGTSGRLFGDRFGSKRIETDAQLLVVAAYIARNPVDAGLCERPEDWAWGSHGTVLGRTAPAWLDVDRLAGYFGGLHRYAEFVEDRSRVPSAGAGPVVAKYPVGV